MKAALAATLLAVGALLGQAAGSAADAGVQVDLIPLAAGINPITASYVSRALQTAQADGAQAAIIQLDTPGGLDTSMRQIVQAMTSSSIPVVVFVAPQGARAGSAGVFITMAADVAAMAPNTNIGAAHPVGFAGNGSPAPASSGSPGASPPPSNDAEVEAQKILNDSVAYIRSLAENHGRNADWAEQAVRESVSVTGQQAVQQHIVDLQAADVQDLLSKLDGREVKLSNGRVTTLHTGQAAVRRIDMSPFESIAVYLADPNLAYILMLIGVYGIIFELSTPGAILPGVMGGLAILLALLALGMLPVNYAGLALIAFSLLLFIADVKMPTHGVLTAGGIISFAFGSLALLNLGSSGLAISIPVILIFTAGTALFFGVIVRLGLRARKAPPTTGAWELVGKVGEAATDIRDSGEVRVNGEWWKAVSDEPIAAGSRVEVLGVRGLTLFVRRTLGASH